jgi:hypothetical protein
MNGETLIIEGVHSGTTGAVYSVSGRKIVNLPKGGYDGTIRWNASAFELPAGVYIVNLQHADKRYSYSAKFIISKQ